MPHYGKRTPIKGRSMSHYAFDAPAKVTARKALTKVNALARRVKAQSAFVDTNLSTTQNTTPTVTGLALIARGDGASDRDGNRVKGIRLYYTLAAFRNSSASLTEIRFVIVRDKQQVADLAPSYADVFESNSVFALRNDLTIERYTVLMDKLVLLDATQRSQWVTRGSLSYKQPIIFNGASVGDIQKNGIFFMIVSNEGSNVPSHVSNLRLTYTR